MTNFYAGYVIYRGTNRAPVAMFLCEIDADKFMADNREMFPSLELHKETVTAGSCTIKFESVP